MKPIRCRIDDRCPFRVDGDARGHEELRTHEVEHRSFLAAKGSQELADALELERYAHLSFVSSRLRRVA